MHPHLGLLLDGGVGHEPDALAHREAVHVAVAACEDCPVDRGAEAWRAARRERGRWEAHLRLT
jgi:hypothetical protein